MISDDDWHVSYANFTPSELETATGLSAELQRVWRRRGQLPRTGTGMTRFTVQEAAALIVRQRLTMVGVAPGDSEAIAEKCAPIVLYCSLMNVPSTCEVYGTEWEVNEFKNSYHMNTDSIKRISGIGDEACVPFLLGTDAGSLFLVASLEEVRSDSFVEYGHFLNLEALGGALAHRARRPLFTVAFAEHDAAAGGPRERRIRDLMAGPTAPESASMRSSKKVRTGDDR